MRRPSVHAIFWVLNEVPFLKASLASVYEFVSGATIITRYDRDNYGNPVDPEGLVDLVLSRSLDPDRKVELIVTNEPSEPRSRNRALAYASEYGRRALEPTGTAASAPRPDFYWHIDADEVYEADDIERLFGWIQRHRAPAYRLEWRSYFRSWNWRIEEQGSFVAITRRGFRFGQIRDAYPSLWWRGCGKLARTGVISPDLAWRLRGEVLVPPSIAVCHHGSYVGSRQRIATKIERSPHREQMGSDWMTRVWDQWTPQMRNFHPTEPERFPVAQYVATNDLPSAIRNATWPDGWIETGREQPSSLATEGA